MILIITATVTGLMAGLFFAWSCSVTIGLARLSNTEYLSAMQSLNRAIQNPLFFACFFGAAILLPVSTFMHYSQASTNQFWLLLSATSIYLIGVMGVTIFGNIPLNNMLDSFAIQSGTVGEIALTRTKFELPWNRLNNIRTVASTASLVLVILACLIRSGTKPLLSF